MEEEQPNKQDIRAIGVIAHVVLCSMYQNGVQLDELVNKNGFASGVFTLSKQFLESGMDLEPFLWSFGIEIDKVKESCGVQNICDICQYIEPGTETETE